MVTCVMVPKGGFATLQSQITCPLLSTAAGTVDDNKHNIKTLQGLI